MQIFAAIHTENLGFYILPGNMRDINFMIFNRGRISNNN